MIKLRPIIWFIIILISFLVPLGIVLLITRIILEPPATWWWFFTFLIVICTGWLVFGLIMLILRLTQAEEPSVKIDPKNAKLRAIHERKHDLDNPDNFIVEEQTINRVGESGKPRTPILHLSGRGSEMNQRLDAIINLDNVKSETSWLVNATKAKVDETIRLMAENPTSEITEKTVAGVDAFGRPVMTTTTKKVTQAEQDKLKEKEEADIANVV